MANFFMDSSALVKRYVNETGTNWVRSITDPSAFNVIYIARIAGAETVSAINRCSRRGTITAAQMAVALADFRHHYALAYVPVEITSSLIAHAMDLAETHGLRGYDAVQLAAALQVQAECTALGVSGITFLSADDSLNAAAAVEGLIVDNPNLHP